MAEQNNVLRNHKLVHLGELRVEETFFSGRYRLACATSRCKGNCCVRGVWTDLLERDAILRNADMVRNHMDPEQEQNPERWFAEICDDADFPSRRAAATAVHNGACVFLNGDRRCVLQKASQNQAPESTIDLKPFFCTAFPITIDTGQLEIADGRDMDCCTLTTDGVLDVFDVCSKELLYVLGEEGLREIQQLFESRPGPKPDSEDA